ncbi:MAG: AI-2E family transporter [Chthoniobacteraceae bacterium]
MKLPTPWQLKTIYASLTALAILAICWVASIVIQVTGDTIKKFQAFLIPLAVAAVLAYLLEPVVKKLCSWKLSRTSAVLIVFGVFIVSSTLIVFSVGPKIYEEAAKFGDKLPVYMQSARNLVNTTVENYKRHSSNSEDFQNMASMVQDWLQKQLPGYTDSLLKFARGSFGGVLGVFGYIVSLLIIPLYLFYFLKESSKIQTNWSNYLPLQASHFKDEVVDVLTEINTYLIAFFRGQLVVSMIDGVLISIGLLCMNLSGSLLIGLMVAILGLIPYLGIFICWVPAVLIAAGQFQDWHHPLIVTGIFIGMNQIESWFIAPRIVGNSVGLHPLTIIASVIGWSLLLGGLLGAILAVPLTATMKVLLRRYVWHRTFKSGSREL